jgi:hypothetical protein
VKPAPKYRTLEDLYARCVPVGECLLWSGHVDQDGYGRIALSARPRRWQRAHRRSWMLAHGEIPDGMQVHHRCGQPLCVRIEHLELIHPQAHGKLHAGPPPDRCQNGHANGRVRSNGRRYCVECHRERGRRYYQLTKSSR